MLKPNDGQLAHSINGVAMKLDCGRTTVYELIRDGRLKAVKLGSRTLVLESSLRGLLSDLPPFKRTADSLNAMPPVQCGLQLNRKNV